MSTTKKVIIIAVIAIILYYLYRRGLFGGTTQAVVTDGSQSTGNDSIQGIINATSMTPYEKSSALGWVATIMNAAKNGTNGWSISALQKRANENGVTYNQQLVLSAVYQMYATSKLFSEDYYNQIANEIKTM